MLSFLDRENTVAQPGFSRWLVPPAALAIHLSIGQIYAYSVFNGPMSRLIGVSEQAPNDWNQFQIQWIFSVAIVVLGASAATFGKWLERVGPRMAMFVAAICFSGGFFVAALGVSMHSIWLVYLGSGVLGGVGLGLGYISPVSTLIKWFPDRPGLATGMAIMGFGGGALLASPLSETLLGLYSTSNSVGVAPTFITLGVLYLCLMMFGAFIVRIPAKGWKPSGYNPEAQSKGGMIANINVDADTAIRTPQFWLLFAVLFLNVTAGIGVLQQASLMIQEMFSVDSVGEAAAVSAAAAAGFVGLLSIFNMLGRFFWSSVSDYIGRKNTYFIFFALGAVLYFLIPMFGNMGSVVLFVLGFCIILTMYGGGFATIPAYLRDLFGTYEVGAIHGRLLLSWSLAGVAGPTIINWVRNAQLNSGVPAAQAYSVTMYIMAGLLIIGFVCNFFVTPVDEKYSVEARENEQQAPSSSRTSEATGD